MSDVTRYNVKATCNDGITLSDDVHCLAYRTKSIIR